MNGLLNVLRLAPIAMVVLGLSTSPLWAANLSPMEGTFAPAEEAHSLKVRKPGKTEKVDLNQIEQLPLFSLTMDPNPTGEAGNFSGVRFLDLLKLLGLDKAERVSLKALDAYQVTLDLGEEKGINQVLFATRFNGQPIPVSDLGPFRLIWPDQYEDILEGNLTAVQWIWNIEEIRLVK